MVGDGQAKPDYSKHEKQRVSAFVASVFQLFPAYGGDLLKDDNFKAQCRIHADSIIKMQPDNYNERLDKIKQLIAVQNFKGFIACYKNSLMALAIATGDMDKLNHDYNLAYPTIKKNDDFHERLKIAKESKSDIETAKKNISRLKGLFNE